MSFSSPKELAFNLPLANGLASQSTQQPRPVCTWSAHAPQSGLAPSPLPRHCHTLTETATAAGELFLFGGYVYPSRCASSDLYVFSPRDFSTTILQTSGDVPGPSVASGATLIGTTLLIFGVKTTSGDKNVLTQRHDTALFSLNLGTSDLSTASPTPADHSFALQCRESGPASWSMDQGSGVITPIPQP